MELAARKSRRIARSGRAAEVPIGVPNRHAAASQDSLLPLLLVVMVSRAKGSSLLMGSLKER
jgi:hypothetical protein